MFSFHVGPVETPAAAEDLIGTLVEIRAAIASDPDLEIVKKAFKARYAALDFLVHDLSRYATGAPWRQIAIDHLNVRVQNEFDALGKAIEAELAAEVERIMQTATFAPWQTAEDAAAEAKARAAAKATDALRAKFGFELCRDPDPDIEKVLDFLVPDLPAGEAAAYKAGLKSASLEAGKTLLHRKETIKTQEGKIKDLEAEIEVQVEAGIDLGGELRAMVAEREAEIADMGARIAGMEAENTTLIGEIQARDQVIEALKTGTSALVEKISDFDRLIAARNDEIEGLRSRLIAARNDEIEGLRSKIGALEGDVDRLPFDRVGLYRRIEDLQSEALENHRALGIRGREIEALKARLAAAQEAVRVAQERAEISGRRVDVIIADEASASGGEA